MVDGGEMKSRRHLNIRGKSASLPSITEKDWDDIRFGVENDVDFFALRCVRTRAPPRCPTHALRARLRHQLAPALGRSFVKDGEVVRKLKTWLRENNSNVQVISKVESADSVQNLEGILDESDGAMVARGDLGAELPVEKARTATRGGRLQALSSAGCGLVGMRCLGADALGCLARRCPSGSPRSCRGAASGANP